MIKCYLQNKLNIFTQIYLFYFEKLFVKRAFIILRIQIRILKALIG